MPEVVAVQEDCELASQVQRVDAAIRERNDVIPFLHVLGQDGLEVGRQK